jgi:hypothetical protein
MKFPIGVREGDAVARQVVDLVERGRKVRFQCDDRGGIFVTDDGPDNPMAFLPIRTGSDGGGWRQFLCGEPIHCGSGLELEARGYVVDDDGEHVEPTGGAILVTYEMDWQGPCGTRRGVIYLHVGGYSFGPKPIAESMRFRWPRRIE